jgi:hypothetical protein
MHRCKPGVAAPLELARGTSPALAPGMVNPDALCGHPLGERVLARQAELEGQIEKLDEGTAEYIGIDTALATLDQYLGADMNHLTDATAHDLNNWLERNKYLGLTNEANAKRAD